MRFRFLFRSILFAGLCAGIFVAPASDSQEPFQWPDPVNLQVLPKDWSGERLRPVMRGFSRRLGVRCSHCHVGQEGAPLSTYDFASDDNPKKETARSMLRMLGVINDSLATIEPSGERVNMWCGTCHRGRPRPMTLSEELAEVYAKNGVDAGIAHYRKLRENFYGRGAYDFGGDDLVRMGYQLLQGKDVAGAIQVFELNTEFFPDDWNAWDSLGEGCAAGGFTERAIACYEKALELNPDNDNAKRVLEELKSQ